MLVVGDRPDDLPAALRFVADAGCELVVTSGGLGPTADDLTAEVVAGFAGVDLVLDEPMRARIARHRGRVGARPQRVRRARRWRRPPASRRWCPAGRSR